MLNWMGNSNLRIYKIFITKIMVFNISLFSEDVKVRRFDERKSLRVAAKDAKVSFSTLSRIENGKIPDLETFGIVCEWLGENHSKYFNKI